MSKKPQGEKVTIEGILYRDGDKVSFKKDDIYKSKGGKEVAESTVTETVATETVSQATQTGIQAVVAQVQTQAANLGLGGCVAVTSGMGFQLEHTIDHSSQAVEKATPMIVEFIETGTIQESIPVGHSKHGQEIPKVNSFLGLKVGEARKEALEEKNKSDEQKALEEAFIESSKPPQVGDKERQGSET